MIKQLSFYYTSVIIIGLKWFQHRYQVNVCQCNELNGYCDGENVKKFPSFFFHGLYYALGPRGPIPGERKFYRLTAHADAVPVVSVLYFNVDRFSLHRQYCLFYGTPMLMITRLGQRGRFKKRNYLNLKCGAVGGFLK